MFTSTSNPILAELRNLDMDWTSEWAGVHAFDAANERAWDNAGQPSDGPGSEWWQFESHAEKVVIRMVNLVLG